MANHLGGQGRRTDDAVSKFAGSVMMASSCFGAAVWPNRDKQRGGLAEDESVPSVMMVTSAQRAGRYVRDNR
jgi:hypothetical protein